jgi:uncharacterized membrane protein
MVRAFHFATPNRSECELARSVLAHVLLAARRSFLSEDNLNDNVETLASLRARAEHGVSHHQRRIERFTAKMGQPRSLYLVLLFAAAWCAFNLLVPRLGMRAFDPPPFDWLQGLVSLCALLMTTTILITQNRQTRHAEQRGQLELQVNLLAEQKIAKLIGLLEELRRDMPIVRNRVDKVAEAMTAPVDPHAVISALEDKLGSVSGTPPPPPPDTSPPPSQD